MNIDSIKNGYVIDHIQAGKGMEIYELLHLNELDCQVAIITNAKSKKTGKKDIIKIDRDIPIDLETLGFVDHNITVNVVKDDKIDQVFILTDKENQVYRCKYCEMSLKK